MRFVTLQRASYHEPGVWWNDEIIGLRDAGFSSIHQILSGGADAMDRVERWIYNPPGSERFQAESVTLLSPVPRPPKLICIGLNYRDHAAEGRNPIPEVPTIFSKFPSAITGHRHPIVLPKNSTKPDYEAEFAVVIGRGGRHIAEADWRKHVFGYTITNDVSARDFQSATSQWMIGKTFDTFAPIGPAIVTADEIEDPHNLRITLTLNGKVMQDSNTNNLIFGLPHLISYLSSVFTLETGDIIATGTPAGVGFARKPPRWLQPGDECRIQIQGLGELVNPVVAES